MGRVSGGTGGWGARVPQPHSSVRIYLVRAYYAAAKRTRDPAGKEVNPVLPSVCTGEGRQNRPLHPGNHDRGGGDMSMESRFTLLGSRKILT